jgi:hypothetical protein
MRSLVDVALGAAVAAVVGAEADDMVGAAVVVIHDKRALTAA